MTKIIMKITMIVMIIIKRISDRYCHDCHIMLGILVCFRGGG